MQSTTSSSTPPANHSASVPVDFRSLILRAAGWSLLGFLTGQVMRLVSSLILTRLLVPEMFGVMAIAGMVQVIVGMLSDVGIRQAVIQSKYGDLQPFLDTAWTLQVMRGVAIWLICIAVAVSFDHASASGWFAPGSVYSAPVLPQVVVAISFTAVIAGFQPTKAITSVRDIDLGRVTVIEFVAQLVSLAVAILIGWLTRSIWSFVVAALVSTIVSTVLSQVCLPGRGNRFRLEREALGELVRFGRWIVLSSSFSVLAANGDRMLLAGWISPTELGIYVLAFNLVALIEGAGGRLFTSVAMPALSKVAREQPESIPRVYYKFRLPFDVFFVGGAGALFGGGQSIISIFYDDRYAGAGQIIQVLSFSLLLARFGIASIVYLALGQPRYQSILNFTKTVSLFVCVPIAYAAFGFGGALWAIALHALPILPMMVSFNVRYRLNNLAFEALVLLVWPVGYAASLFAVWAMDYWRMIL